MVGVKLLAEKQFCSEKMSHERLKKTPQKMANYLLQINVFLFLNL